MRIISLNHNNPNQKYKVIMTAELDKELSRDIVLAEKITNKADAEHIKDYFEMKYRSNSMSNFRVVLQEHKITVYKNKVNDFI